MIREFLIVMGITLAGNLLSPYAPIPIPGPVIGLTFLLVLLALKKINLKSVTAVTELLLGNLAFLFLPPGVGLINSASLLKGNWGKLLFLVVATTVVTIGVTGWTVQILSKKTLKEEVRGELDESVS